MMDEARLISTGLGGADALFPGVCKTFLSGDLEGIRAPRPASTGCLLVTGAKASSTSFELAVWDMSVPSKSNFIPFSCRIENWSSVGNLFDSSSAPFKPDDESSAAKGSPLLIRIGEGLGFVDCVAGWALEAGSLPLRMGAMSGITVSFCSGGENTAPTTGVEEFEMSCRAARASACAMPAYI